MPDDAELKRLAEAATRGEWRARTGLRYVYSDNSAPRSSYVCEVSGAGARLANLRYIAAANPATILRLLRERDEARAEAASAQYDVEVYRDAVIEARELARVRLPHHDLLRVDLLRIFEDLHSLPALDADQGEGEGA